MKVVICYPHVNAYMAACWRELAARPGIDLFVVGFRAGTKKYPVGFGEKIMSGLNYRLLTDDEIDDADLVASIVREHRPDVVMVSGWAHRAYRCLAFDSELIDVDMIMLMDNQRKGTLRQLIGRWILRRYLNRMRFIFVIGERSWQLTQYWGVPQRKVRRCCCGIDYRSLSLTYARRIQVAEGWPQGFLYVGRYAPLKGVDLLLEAYQRYRQLVAEPWPLRCAGMGPLESLVSSTEGVENLGFVQPEAVAELFGKHAAFVLFGRYDAWPLSLVEACAAGLPVVCSEACGSSVEMIRPYFNGLTVPTGDIEELARALCWMHENKGQIPEMGARGHALAKAYSAELWADRTIEMLTECGYRSTSVSAAHSSTKGGAC